MSDNSLATRMTSQQRIRLALTLDPEDFQQNQRLLEMLLDEMSPRVINFILGRVKVEEMAAVNTCILIASEAVLPLTTSRYAFTKLQKVPDPLLRLAAMHQLQQASSHHEIRVEAYNIINSYSDTIVGVPFGQRGPGALRTYLVNRNFRDKWGDT